MKIVKELIRLKILVLELYCLCVIFIALVGHLQNDGENDDELNKVIPVRGSSSPHVDKVVLIIIDAMRYDFLLDMPFVKTALSDGDGSCIFKVRLSGPTVTLPRIKALVTGTSSSYWDFLANLKQTEGINSDNVITKVREGGKQIVFYGDDTWLRLFPGDIFVRSEGVSSFFVTDFYEVDNNVTRNVKLELETLNFDLMILHYLGVDHVGHVHGPKHALIPRKLYEMNEVIAQVYSSLKNAPSDLPHMIIVTGDHGMANQGGHGGDSYPEVTTPMVLMTVQPGNVTSRICKRPRLDWFQNPFHMKQTDIAAVLTFLWDIPFPSKSRGVIPREILSQFDPATRTKALLKNSQQLAKFLTRDSHARLLLKLDRLVEDYFKTGSLTAKESAALEDNFGHLLSALRKEAVQEIDHDLVSLIFSILLLLFLIPFGTEAFLDQPIVSSTLGIILSALVPQIYVSVTCIQCLVIFYIYLLQKSRGILREVVIFNWSLTLLLTLVYLLSPLLFFSSSFVEEEHFFLYYLYATVVFLMMLVKKNWNLILILPLHRLCSVLNATGQKWNNELDLNDWLNDISLDKTVSVLAFFLVFAYCCTNFVQRFTVVIIALYKLEIFDVFFDPTLGHHEAKLCYLLIATGALYCKHDLSSSWIMLSCLLQRPENLILVAMVSFQMKLISSVECSKARGLIVNILFFASFYYQGNSNHITTIDISLGYTGLSEYNEVLVGILTFVSTFTLPILVFLLGLEYQSQDVPSEGATSNEVMHLLVMKIAMTNFIYGIVVSLMRKHLFVWSVFVPKLLYLIGFTFLTVTFEVFIAFRELALHMHSIEFKFRWNKKK